jgi:hypothetical protein
MQQNAGLFTQHVSSIIMPIFRSTLVSAAFWCPNHPTTTTFYGLVHVGCVVMKMADGQGFLRVICISSVSVILPFLHTNSLTCHQNYTVFDS